MKTFVKKMDTDYLESNQCCMCGRETDESLWVHTYGGGDIIHPNDPDINDESGYTGMFTIGSTCAKQLPPEYIVKL